MLDRESIPMILIAGVGVDSKNTRVVHHHLKCNDDCDGFCIVVTSILRARLLEAYERVPCTVQRPPLRYGIKNVRLG